MTTFTDAWSLAMWQASLQGGLLLLLVWSLCRLFPSIPARFQSWLWRLVMLKFLVALFVSAPVEVPWLPATNPAIVKVATPTISKSLEHAPPLPVDRATVREQPSSLASHGLIALIVWTGVVGWQLTRIWKGCRQARLLRKNSRPIVDSAMLVHLANAGETFGLRTLPRLLEMDGSGSPLLVGILSPAIVIPATTLSRLDPSERATAVAHELAHIRRGDLFWNLIAAIVRAVFFFHPFAWIAERRLKLVQEIAADELAIRRQHGDAKSYAALLVSIVSKLGTDRLIPTMTVGTAGSQESLTQRLIAMRSMKPISVRSALACGILVTVVGVLGIVPWTVVAAEPTRKNDQAINGKFDSIVLSELDFLDASVTDVVDYLVLRAKQLDPERHGVNILLMDKENKATITLSLKNVSLHQVLRLVAEQAGLSLEFDQATAILKKPKEKALGPVNQAALAGTSIELSKKLDSIVLPEIDFLDTGVDDVIQYLLFAGKQYDPDKKGVNILPMFKENKATITMSLRNVSLHHVLRFVAEMAGLSMELDIGTVVLRKSQ